MNPSSYRCQARLKSRGGKRCGKEGATPRFTVKLAPETRGQPKFICDEHDAAFPAVSPLTGEKRERLAKTYELREGKLIPIFRKGVAYGTRAKDFA